jgi:uncharacterized membrane protein
VLSLVFKIPLLTAGCGVLAAGAVSGKEKAVTLWGDLAAFAAAVCIVVHWQIGKKLRRCAEVVVQSVLCSMRKC